MDDRRRPLPEGRGPRAPADPGRPELVEERVLAIPSARGRTAMQDRRLAGLERKRQVAPQVRQLVRDRREDAVVVQPGLPDGDDGRASAPRAEISAQPASSTFAASCGCTPTDASSHGCASASSSARSHDRTFQPGTRIRSSPAARARSRTSSTSASKRSALRWQWLSTSGTTPIVAARRGALLSRRGSARARSRCPPSQLTAAKRP